MSKIKVTGINDIDQIIYDYKNSMEIWESRKQDVKKHIEECLGEEFDTEYVYNKILEQYKILEQCDDEDVLNILHEDFDMPVSPSLVEFADYFIHYDIDIDEEMAI